MKPMEFITNINVYQEYQLSKFDSTMGIWPYIRLISWYKHRIDSHRLKIAIQQIVDSVPILGGRLVKKLFSPLKVVCKPYKSGVGFLSHKVEQITVFFNVCIIQRRINFVHQANRAGI